MTKLQRVVRRKAEDGRVVILHPRDGSNLFETIEVRATPRSKGYRVTLGQLHTFLAMREAGLQHPSARRKVR